MKEYFLTSPFSCLAAIIFQRFFQLSAVLCIVSSSSAAAQGFLENTFLLDLRLGSGRSDIARSLSIGGYELSGGARVDFSDWYSPSVPDFNVIFLTQVRPDFGVTWGFSTGERGEKYKIKSGLWLGFIYQVEPTNRSNLSVSAITMVGGDFRERICVADYGDLGGRQPVNCRLAASTLPPNETMRFLVSEKGYIETQIAIRYEFRF